MHLHIQAPVPLFQVFLHIFPGEQATPGLEHELFEAAVQMAFCGNGPRGFI
jgi:hypothetical protein